LNVGVVICKDLDNAGNPEEVRQAIREKERSVREAYSTETLSQNPKIDVWRKAYSAFGAKPKENRSSVEALYRSVLQGNELRHINKLVDIYNLISLKHMVPVGGEDTDKVKGDIALTFAGPGEPPVLLLGDKDARPPHAGEVIYKDEVSAICRRWNWREADRTKFAEKTRNCLLVMEGLPPVTKEEIKTAAAELRDLVQKFCGGNVSYVILNDNKPEIDLL
jgi:lysyl-tRNA synthetase class 2